MSPTFGPGHFRKTTREQVLIHHEAILVVARVLALRVAALDVDAHLVSKAPAVTLVREAFEEVIGV